MGDNSVTFQKKGGASIPFSDNSNSGEARTGEVANFLHFLRASPGGILACREASAGATRGGIQPWKATFRDSF